MSRRPVSAAALALAALVLTVAPAAAAREAIPPRQACLDVTHGEGTLSILGLTQLGSDHGNTVQFSIDLAAPTCTDGTYRFDVVDDDGGGLITTQTLAGDGTSTRLTATADVPPEPDGCIAVQVFTFDERGRTVDVAPDDGMAGIVGDAECGGGGSVWK